MVKAAASTVCQSVSLCRIGLRRVAPVARSSFPSDPSGPCMSLRVSHSSPVTLPRISPCMTRKTRYRPAPVGTHRAKIGIPDPSPRSRNASGASTLQRPLPGVLTSGFEGVGADNRFPYARRRKRPGAGLTLKGAGQVQLTRHFVHCRKDFLTDKTQACHPVFMG